MKRLTYLAAIGFALVATACFQQTYSYKGRVVSSSQEMLSAQQAYLDGLKQALEPRDVLLADHVDIYVPSAELLFQVLNRRPDAPAEDIAAQKIADAKDVRILPELVEKRRVFESVRYIEYNAFSEIPESSENYLMYSYQTEVNNFTWRIQHPNSQDRIEIPMGSFSSDHNVLVLEWLSRVEQAVQ